MTDDDEIDRMLAPYVAAGQREAAELPVGFMARVQADAARVQADWQAEAMRRARSVRVPIWRQFLTILGGAPALGGLMAACATGIWLGASPPQGFDPLAFVVGGSDTLTFYSSVQDTVLSEESP